MKLIECIQNIKHTISIGCYTFLYRIFSLWWVKRRNCVLDLKLLRMHAKFSSYLIIPIFWHHLRISNAPYHTYTQTYKNTHATITHTICTQRYKKTQTYYFMWPETDKKRRTRWTILFTFWNDLSHEMFMILLA